MVENSNVIASNKTELRPCWFVGASWNSEDQTERFINEGIWKNGYEDKYLSKVNSIEVGDKIAIKAAYTKKHGLDFDCKGNVVSVLAIKATGIVTQNLGDGQTVKVDWTPELKEEREWYFYTFRGTIWEVNPSSNWYAKELCDFTFKGKDQDIQRFRNDPYWVERYGDFSEIEKSLGAFLDRTAKAKKLKNRKQAAEFIVEKDDWNEVRNRRACFDDVGQFFAEQSAEPKKLQAILQKSGIMPAHGSFGAMVSAFFRHKQTKTWLRQFSPSHPFTQVNDINELINEVEVMGFQDNHGKQKRSEAAFFLSILLASVYPEEYMEFRQTRVDILTDELNTPRIKGDYGERFLQLSQFYRTIYSTSVFQENFSQFGNANAIVGGLTWIFEDKEKWLQGEDMTILKSYLEEFSKIAPSYFEDNQFVIDTYYWYKKFFAKEKLSKAEWRDFQELGEHIHAFNSNSLAKANAFGRENYPIEEYRRSFDYLAYGKGDVLARMREFMNDNVNYTSKYIGKSALSEIIGQIFPEKYIFMNARDVGALKLLGIDPDYKRGDDFVTKFEKFNKALLPIVEAYKGIVEQQTEVPIGLEVDQFLSWVYEHKQEDDSLLIQKSECIQDTGLDISSRNQILYGPPGTGKTYNTVLEAVKICEPSFKGDYGERYKELQEEGRIEFVTFHQSYGYEEFIEGIRAETIENKNGTSSISYDVQPGVFKRISKLASKNSGSKKSGIKEFSDVFKDAVIDKVSKDEKLEITMTRSRYFIKEVTERTIFFDKDKGESKHSLSIKTLQKIYDAGSNQIIVGGLQPYYEALLQYLNEYSQVSIPVEKKNYVLIIDEINRGNMSKIFGELITLIEDDKRIGAKNEMEVRLPVSGDTFGVPKNLHIIGTMNTADRSIAMMDTALRRRFEFEEMMPNPCLLHDNLDEHSEGEKIEWECIDEWDLTNQDEDNMWDYDWIEEGDSVLEGKVNLRRMLHAMNQRIEVLYDREHTIGHAYFMGLSSSSSIEELGKVFSNKIIPLLAEYFFEDWEKIRMVLGDDQKGKKQPFVLAKKRNDDDLFFGEPPEYAEEQVVYKRNPAALSEVESYVGIYTKLKDEEEG